MSHCGFDLRSLMMSDIKHLFTCLLVGLPFSNYSFALIVCEVFLTMLRYKICLW